MFVSAKNQYMGNNKTQNITINKLLIAVHSERNTYFCETGF